MKAPANMKMKLVSSNHCSLANYLVVNRDSREARHLPPEPSTVAAKNIIFTTTTTTTIDIFLPFDVYCSDCSIGHQWRMDGYLQPLMLL